MFLDLVLFRTEDGRVVGNCLECPFHAWRFDGHGQCAAIPYAEKVPPRARLRAWPAREVNGLIMVWSRIRDVLADLYPRLVAIVGDEALHDQVTDHLVACPPAHPSITRAGARLPAFVAGHAHARERPWLGDLAAIEWATVEVHDGPDACRFSSQSGPSKTRSARPGRDRRVEQRGPPPVAAVEAEATARQIALRWNDARRPCRPHGAPCPGRSRPRSRPDGVYSRQRRACRNEFRIFGTFDTFGPRLAFSRRA